MHLVSYLIGNYELESQSRSQWFSANGLIRCLETFYLVLDFEYEKTFRCGKILFTFIQKSVHIRTNDFKRTASSSRNCIIESMTALLSKGVHETISHCKFR